MKKAYTLAAATILLIAAILTAAFLLAPREAAAPTDPVNHLPAGEGGLPAAPEAIPARTAAPLPAAPAASTPAAETVAEDLSIPWGLAWLPGGELLVTERPGRLLQIGTDRNVIPISGVAHVGEGGLLGVAVHPRFSDKGWIYLYLTTRSGGGLINRVERYELQGNQLTNRQVIIDSIPGAQFHDGGLIAFGSDGLLYVTTGDAGREELAQDTASLAGKILRVHDDGRIPADNPFNSAVYSYGHRNVQGLAWDSSGQLWATEHGRSGIASGFDEVNKIEAGKNYGWPEIQGDEEQAGMQRPYLHSGPRTTWAPAGAVIIGDRLFFGGLRGEALYEMPLTGEPRLTSHFHRDFGRIRAVSVGPEGLLYITTSNRDGRGNPGAGDDKIIRVNPAAL